MAHALDHAATRIVAGVKYLVHPQVLGTVLETNIPHGIHPVVVLASEHLQDATRQLARFEQVDDVFTKAFAQSVVLISDNQSADIDTQSNLHQLGNFSSLYHAATPNPSGALPPGPYFLHGSSIHQAWRLYPDYLDAFIFGVVPEDVTTQARFSTVSSVTDDGMWKEIAVPSRLYAKPSPDRPLAGTRISLKDIFRLAGTKTTMMSKAYTALYEPEAQSADYVKKLVAKGAVIVGKTKMTQFASSDEPTDQWIDFHCPVNPRGDEYQSPSGSSSGAAAALAGYTWLDYSVPGDSAGSVRAPATCNGLFSIRPSVGSTSMDGIVINSRLFDVVGLFSRDLQGLHHLLSETMDLNNNSTKFPSKILYPLDFFPHSNEKHQAMVDEFVGILEDFLGTNKVEFSIAERWDKCPPPEANGKSLKQYLAKSAFWPMCHDYYHGFDDFRAKYKEKYSKEPYEGPVVQFRWGIGKEVTEQDYQTYEAELAVFRKWFDQNVLTTDADSLSDAIMIMPYGSAKPKYRDSPNEDPSTSHTIGEKFISPVLHMPQVVLPFGQMPYESRVSKRLEHRPIGSTIVGAKGSDLMLLKLAKAAFDAASWPTEVATGRYMFPLADNVRNTAPVGSVNSQSML